MAGKFGGVFDPECTVESSAARLGSRFGLNPQQELNEHERNRNVPPGQPPASFDMAHLLGQINNIQPQSPSHVRTPQNALTPRSTSHQPPMMMEAAAFPAAMPLPMDITPFGSRLDFHYANMTRPPIAMGTMEYEGAQQYHHQQEAWDDKLLSLSWHEAQQSRQDDPEIAEVPWYDAVTEIENQDDIASEFWSNSIQMSDLMKRPTPEYEFEFSADQEIENDAHWALEEGLKALSAGDVPTAVYLLETAVRIEPENAEAWYQLGTAQQLNENDKSAIAALEKCLVINNKHPLARVALSASFTNELRRADALMALAEWSDLFLGDGGTDRKRWEAMSDFSGYTFQHELFTETESRLLRVLEQSPSADVSATVQSALGIIYNISEEYEKAASHFQRAINDKPDDAVLYNRLGASLANGDRNADAIAAYCRALELSPGLLRTRYNLGIASCNLHAYKEAVGHFLSVLNKQNDSRSTFVPVPPPVNDIRRGLSGPGASSSVWSSLRMAFLAMDRRDLYDLALDEKLVDLNEAFNSIPDNNNPELK